MAATWHKAMWLPCANKVYTYIQVDANTHIHAHMHTYSIHQEVVHAISLYPNQNL